MKDGTKIRRIRFRNENDFKKKLKALKKYCANSYKYLCFELIDKDLFEVLNGTYYFDLPTSNEFKMVYGQLRLKYSIYGSMILLEDIEPSEFLKTGFCIELNSYKGMFYANKKDKFKIELMNYLKKEGK